MNKPTPKKKLDLEDQIMSRINDSNLRMKPKIYYFILGLVMALAVVAAVVMSAYFVSLTSLFIRSRIAQGPAHGIQRNLAELLVAFPWWALILGILSIAATIYLVIKSGKLYKIRLAYLIPVTTAIILIFGFALSYVSLPNIFNGRGNNITGPSGRSYQRGRQ